MDLFKNEFNYILERKLKNSEQNKEWTFQINYNEKTRFALKIWTHILFSAH